MPARLKAMAQRTHILSTLSFQCSCANMAAAPSTFRKLMTFLMCWKASGIRAGAHFSLQGRQSLNISGVITRTPYGSLTKQSRRTPTIFEPRRLHALIMLKDGNKAKAHETLNLMHEMVNARNPDERRTNFRAYLETNAEYLVETSRYKEAKEIYEDQAIFTDDERKKAVRKIEIAEGFAKDRAKTT